MSLQHLSDHIIFQGTEDIQSEIAKNPRVCLISHMQNVLEPHCSKCLKYCQAAIVTFGIKHGASDSKQASCKQPLRLLKLINYL